MGGVTEWALVPRDPTDEMVDAAWDSDAVDYVGEHKRIHSATAAWTAMLAAAPTPPADPNGFTVADMMDARKEERERLTGAQSDHCTKHQRHAWGCRPCEEASGKFNDPAEAQVVGGGDDPQWFADALSAAGKSEPLPASGGFEEWFGAVWAGSDNIPVPEWRSEGWGRYIAQRQLALDAWQAALSAQPRPRDAMATLGRHVHRLMQQAVDKEWSNQYFAMRVAGAVQESVGDTAQPRLEPSLDEALRGLIRSWREPEPDNGEIVTDFDSGCEQTYLECAIALETILGPAQPASAPKGKMKRVDVPCLPAAWDSVEGYAAGWNARSAIADQPESAPVGVDEVTGIAVTSEFFAGVNAALLVIAALPASDDESHEDAYRAVEALTQQPAATLPDEDDSDLTVAYMAGRHDGRKESRQPAAERSDALDLAEEDAALEGDQPAAVDEAVRTLFSIADSMTEEASDIEGVSGWRPLSAASTHRVVSQLREAARALRALAQPQGEG